MNIAKKYYEDANGNMVGYPRYRRDDLVEKEPCSFKGRLKIQRLGWLNNGFYLVVEDENGKTFNLNDAMFREYLKRNDVYLDGEWTFYSQGTAYSIGLVEE